MIIDLSSAATIVTILYFIAGTTSTRQFIRLKSTGSSSFIPFAATFCNCIFWLKYGILCDDRSIISVNGFGAILAVISCLIFYRFCDSGNVANGRGIVEKTALVYGVWIVFVLFIVKYGGWTERSSKVSFMGWICSVMTVIMFASPLVSLKLVVSSRDSSVMNLPLTICGLVVGLLWSVYGLELGDPFVYVTNGLGCILSLLQLLVLVKYRPSLSVKKMRSPKLGEYYSSISTQ